MVVVRVIVTAKYFSKKGCGEHVDLDGIECGEGKYEVSLILGGINDFIQC